MKTVNPIQTTSRAEARIRGKVVSFVSATPRSVPSDPTKSHCTAGGIRGMWTLFLSGSSASVALCKLISHPIELTPVRSAKSRTAWRILHSTRVANRMVIPLAWTPSRVTLFKKAESKVEPERYAPSRFEYARYAPSNRESGMCAPRRSTPIRTSPEQLTGPLSHPARHGCFAPAAAGTAQAATAQSALLSQNHPVVAIVACCGDFSRRTCARSLAPSCELMNSEGGKAFERYQEISDGKFVCSLAKPALHTFALARPERSRPTRDARAPCLSRAAVACERTKRSSSPWYAEAAARAARERVAKMVSLSVVNCPSQDLAITNKVFASAETLGMMGTSYVQIEGLVYTMEAHPTMAPGTVALNTVQRRNLRVSSGDALEVSPFASRAEDCVAATMMIDIQFFTMKKGKEETLDAVRISDRVKQMLGRQIFTVGQRFVLSYIDTNYSLTVVSVGSMATGEDAKLGLLDASTSLVFETPSGSGVKITNQKTTANKLFRTKEFNFESIGIGGLDSQFDEIFRRAFASRVYPPHVIEKLGIRHIKGMLLFGPPGTGKTLIARQIGKMLNAREPKVVNGPEVLNKYVGASEENVRKLFAEAEEEYQAKGDESELHIIIFDEIDAICKSRGSSRDGTGVHDTLVNQLLTKIDGVDALNNVLLIGMTNRRDMLDEAMLR